MPDTCEVCRLPEAEHDDFSHYFCATIKLTNALTREHSAAEALREENRLLREGNEGLRVMLRMVEFAANGGQNSYVCFWCQCERPPHAADCDLRRALSLHPESAVTEVKK